jgi:hypothetical protein
MHSSNFTSDGQCPSAAVIWGIKENQDRIGFSNGKGEDHFSGGGLLADPKHVTDWGRKIHGEYEVLEQESGSCDDIPF